MEIKTEADSNDITECPHDDKPITGVYGFLMLNSLHSFVCISYVSCLHCIHCAAHSAITLGHGQSCISSR